MDLIASPEQDELRSSVRRFLERKSPSDVVRTLMDDPAGYDPAVWSQMADQLGLQGLTIPEEFGGSGFGFVELTIVLEEMGRVLLPSPYFSTVVLAAQAILDSGDTDAAKQLLPGIADGSTIATLAFTEQSGHWDLNSIEMSATHEGDSWTLSGTKSYVIDGHIAGLIIVAAQTDAGLTLFAVDGTAAGLCATAVPALDQTRKLATINFDAVAGTLIGTPGSATQSLAKTLDKVALALASEQVGGAQRAMDMAVAYSKIRTQFDQPIGSFQALKHRASEVMLRVESARAAAYYGAWAVAEDSDEVPTVASLAKAYCSEAYFHAAAENIQMHGGIGFTWEHDAHLYFKRAKASQLFLGDGTYHRERLADLIGI
ncbi:MAG: acyl-CoA dehydrogenase family protein [Antricoccus sp.]